MFRFRYVTLQPNASIADLDAAMRTLRTRRKAAGFAIVRTWIDAEMDAVLDMRNAAVLEAMV